MNSEQTIRKILDEFNLLPLYGGHRLHGDYPLINLNGTLKADRLIESAHFTYVGHLHGQMTELWAGESVTFTTTEGEVTSITTTDATLQAMVETHLQLAVKDIRQALLLDFADEEPLVDLPIEQRWQTAIEAETGLDEIFAFQARQREEDLEFHRVNPPEGGLQSLSREERLDRARALKGHYVRDIMDVRDAERAAEKQLLFALTFKPMEIEEERTEEQLEADFAEYEEREFWMAQARPFFAEGGPYNDDDLRF